MSYKYVVKKNKNLFVIGIEALKDNIDKLLKGEQTLFHHRNKEHYLDTNYINKRCILLNYAIVNSDNESINFYKTVDSGQCSIYEPPKTRDIYNIEKIIKVPCCTLKKILSNIQFNDDIKYIIFLKIDVQGADLDVVKSGGDILKNKVVYITLEAETSYGSHNMNSTHTINKYMNTIGFTRVNLKTTNDPTFLNNKFKHLFPPEKYNIICIQNN